MKVKSPKMCCFALLVVVLQCMIFSELMPFPKIFHYNKTPSLSIGLYCEVPFERIEKDDLVLLEIPESVKTMVLERKWMEENELLLKKVGAIEGDVFNISDKQLEINNSYIGPVYEVDSQNRPMPVLRGTFEVSPGHILPIATNVSNSFDGRYFGTVPVSAVKAKVIFLLPL